MFGDRVVPQARGVPEISSGAGLSDLQTRAVEAVLQGTPITDPQEEQEVVPGEPKETRVPPQALVQETEGGTSCSKAIEKVRRRSKRNFPLPGPYYVYVQL